MTQALRTALLAGFGLLTAASSVLAQRTAGYGDWQLHLPTNRARVLADTGPRIYAAAEDAFFVFDKETSSVQRLSRRDGLSDVDVRELAYDSLTQQVVVAYRSGQIDILSAKGRVVASLSDIKRKTLAGAKLINRVDVARRLAYVSTNFGIVVVDLQRFEVKDTYANFGPGGTVPQVYATAVQGDTLYAATSAGLLRGNLNTNLLNYNNWRSAAGFGSRAGDPYRTLVTHRGKVFAGINGDNLYRAVGAGWVSLNFAWGPEPTCYALRSSAAGLLVTENNRVSVLDTRTNQVRNRLQPTNLVAGRDAIRSRSGPVYVADFANGLIRVDLNGQNAASFVANAPASNRTFGIVTDPASKTVTVFPGGYDEGYVQTDIRFGFFVYDADGRWTNYNSENFSAAAFPNLKDMTRGVRTPDGTLYASSYGEGLLAWKGPGQWQQFTQGSAGSPLLSAIPANPSFTRLTDVAAAPNGDVWVVNRHQLPQQPGVFRFTPSSGLWQSVPWFVGAENLERITVDDLGHLWLGRARRDRPGLVAYNPETNAVRPFGESEGLPNGTVWDLAKDRRGAIWVTTNKGAAVYDDPSLAFDAGAAGFRTPIVRRGEGTGFPTLWTEVVKCVAVDGANRKWFGTDKGLWLFNEDGDEALQHFTTDNSPLPSDRIVDVAVDDRTGEVWVGTEAGLVSYRGSATVTEGAPSCAKVFPNPVRQDFSGQVGISGLVNNAQVKITDVTGTLVYQTRATGGTVVWNLADYNGRRVQSGVYLVLTADADGKNGCVSKVAVLTK
ncbi:T9SS type A sorting domain-containing protein [Hymenobacter sp. 15J16-1T3B]|uniref:type IX secretion system anionic LPS delivery protein PorZ n=1 Tax=Hymenobacter sp. 15J16-1T3B TaxID=2886941 RepID=UPI001D10F7AD|nr:T9SS type A sorting domain-containing protein [Hymenobacter sp. 15J16-1T3B]MCC3157910.1 T9SS type A sorting domain-containing protein [Hymenobacter sp. 15J16-1T3B]